MTTYEKSVIGGIANLRGKQSHRHNILPLNYLQTYIGNREFIYPRQRPHDMKALSEL